MKSKTLIQKLVQRGYALHLEVTARSEELEDIKDALKTEAAARPQEYVPLSSGSGEQWIASAPEAECRIVFPSPRLVSLLDPRQVNLATVQALAGNRFDNLFQNLTFYRLVDKESFRQEISQNLKSDEAQRLLTLCSTPVEPRATWKAR